MSNKDFGSKWIYVQYAYVVFLAVWQEILPTFSKFPHLLNEANNSSFLKAVVLRVNWDSNEGLRVEDAYVQCT